MATGQPCSSPKARTSSGSVMDSVVPGHAGDAGRARPRCASEILSPITSMASGGGPMNATPRSVMARAKSAFSEKKP